MTKKAKKSATGGQSGHPQSVDALNEAITARYSQLSRRLQQVAQYVIDHPNDMAMETLAVIGVRCKVQPSTVVRFAKAFGFDGASQMQRLFRDKLLDGYGAQSYQERVRRARETGKEYAAPDSMRAMLNEITEGNIVALEHLHESVSEQSMRQAAVLIDNAETVFVTGLRRSFPVAAFISYTLYRFGKRTSFIDGVGGLESIQSDLAGKRDLLIAISFKPYAPETIEFVSRAAQRKCKILTITDSQFSPIASLAEVVMVVNEAEVRGFRSLTSSLTLAQAMLLAYAFKAQQNLTGEVGDILH